MNNVSRETQDTAPQFMQRIGDEGMRNMEKLCAAAATLTDRYYMPLIVLVELSADQGSPVRNMTVHCSQNMPGEAISMFLKAATEAIESKLPQAQAQQPEPLDDDADQKVGDPIAADQAMTEALEQPRANGADG